MRQHVLEDDRPIAFCRDTRYATKMVQFAGILPGAQPKPTPTLIALMEPANREDLLEETATRYRSIVRIAMYLAKDRPDLLLQSRC